MKYDVVIIGGGAAGLTAAYTIAYDKLNRRILVIEKSSSIGKKLSASGNGKCNLTNARFGKEHYFSENIDFVEKWTSQHAYQDVVDLFSDMGVLLYQKDGYYYPLSNQARQVTDAFMYQCKKQNVSFLMNTSVKQIKPNEKGYQIITDSQESNKIECSSVILCAGSAAAPKLGGTKDGITIAKQLGIKTAKVYPALTPAYISDSNLKLAKGVRQEAIVSLKEPNGSVRKERGQIQINEDSVSGIAMMNLSCLFNGYDENDRQDCIWIDILPDYSWDELKGYVQNQIKNQPSVDLRYLLNGLFPAKLATYILSRLKLKDEITLAELSEKHVNRIVSLIKKMTFTPIIKFDYDKAQVAAGGIELSEINWDNYETLKYKGIFCVGEVLDMTGECGGYNLTFAILSAKDCAEYIIQERKYHD